MGEVMQDAWNQMDSESAWCLGLFSFSHPDTPAIRHSRMGIRLMGLERASEGSFVGEIVGSGHTFLRRSRPAGDA
jgi:hypothetical protein